jgi:hypothetical protein
LSWDSTVSTHQRVPIQCWKDLPGGGTNDYSINGFEIGWGDYWVLGFKCPRGVHFPKDLFGEGLLASISFSSSCLPREGPREREGGKRRRRGDVQDIRPNLCSGRFDSFNDSLGELLDMSVGRVKDYSDDGLGPYRQYTAVDVVSSHDG